MKRQISAERREQLRRYCREYWARNKDTINRKRRAKRAAAKAKAKGQAQG